MTALRCPVCLVNWPYDHKRYGVCLSCGAKTDWSGSEPMTESEANHLAFEAYYAERAINELHAALDKPEQAAAG